jgi:hypothetical protein
MKADLRERIEAGDRRDFRKLLQDSSVSFRNGTPSGKAVNLGS